MPVLRDLSYAGYVPSYVPLPNQMIDRLGASLEKDYTENKNAADLLTAELNKIPVRDVNMGIRDQAIEQARKGLDQIAAKGDWENAASQIKQVARDVADNKLLQGAIQDKVEYDKWKAELDKNKDKIDPDRYESAINYGQALNNKPIEYDPNTGYKNMYRGYTPMQTPDISKTIGEFADKIKASEKPVQVGTTKDGSPITMWKDPATNQFFVSGSREGVDEGEAMKMLTGFVLNDPKIAGYINEGAMFNRFKNKYDPATGTYNPVTVDDFGGAEAFDQKVREAGLNPADFVNDPAKLEKLYNAMYTQNQAEKYAEPYAQQSSYTKTKLAYHQDAEQLAKTKADLSLRNSLKEIAAKEAADKRITKYKFDLDKEEKQRETIISAPVEAQPVIDYNTADNSVKDMQQDLDMLKAKARAASTGIPNANGDVVTITPEELNKIRQLETDIRVRKAEQTTYMNLATSSITGKDVMQRMWDQYWGATKGKPEITQDEFNRRLQTGNIGDPKRITKVRSDGSMMSGTSTFQEDDPNDVNTWLAKAKSGLIQDKKVQTEVNNAPKAMQANAWWGNYSGSDDKTDGKSKDGVVSQISRNLTEQVVASGGLGYDVIGASTTLDNWLHKQGVVMTGEGATMKGKPVKLQVVPLDRSQPGFDENETMYYMVARDPNTNEVKASMRIRPQDQASHGDLMRRMYGDVANSYDENTEIGKNARLSIAHHDYPQFQLEKQRTLLDNGVNAKSHVGQFAVGDIVKTDVGNYVPIKKKASVISGFDDSGHPIYTTQNTFQIVQLRPNLPPNTVITEQNVRDYLPDPRKTVDDYAIENPRYLQNENVKKEAAKNPFHVRNFASLEDANLEWYNSFGKK